MRRRYLISAAVVLLSVCLCIWLISNPRWIIDYRKDGSSTRYGLFVVSVCPPPGMEQQCVFSYYQPKQGSALYQYYKAGTVGAAFMITGTVLYLIFAFFMLIKASTGMAGRCLHHFFKNYYVLYYVGFAAALCQSLGWGLYLQLVPKNYKFRYPVWVFLANWISALIVVLVIFVRKVSQRGKKKRSYVNIT